MFKRRKVEELSVEELERMLLIKKRQSRLERFQRLSDQGQPVNQALLSDEPGRPGPAVRPPVPAPGPETRAPLAAPGFKAAVLQPLGGRWWGRRKDRPGGRTRSRKLMDLALLGLEVVSLVGLIGVLVASYFNLRELNDEVSLAQQGALVQQASPPTPAPAIAVARLPGGHSSPTSPGGAAPDVPLHLQQWVQPSAASASAAVPLAPSKAGAPTRIVIPKIKVDAPIVNGVGWEDLKQGVGHLPGSANPGERGNMYLAAHNDIFGEIFRYLEDLEPGDEYFIYTGGEKFRYVVKEKRIIEPTQVEVMLPTTEPVATLQTCYPYLVDTHRLVVIGELAE